MYQNAHILWKKVSTRGKNGWVALSLILRLREIASKQKFLFVSRSYSPRWTSVVVGFSVLILFMDAVMAIATRSASFEYLAWFSFSFMHTNFGHCTDLA